jgi:hypothetical protein
MPMIDPRDFDRALEGIDFPTSRDAILRSAEDKGGINRLALDVLALIPDQPYDTREELQLAIAEAYAEAITSDEDAPPAAPADPQTKADTAASADTRA